MEIPWYKTKVNKDLKLSRDKFQGSYRPKLEKLRVTVVVISFTGGVREVEDVFRYLLLGTCNAQYRTGDGASSCFIMKFGAPAAGALADTGTVLVT